jgi:ribosome recycling factor
MIDEILLKTEKKMAASTQALKREIAAIRTGRATTGLVDHIKVDYSGVPTPLNHLANISIPGAKYLLIQPWDKGIIQNIEKAILKSDLGLTPSSDGTVIRLNIPPLSEERRQELIKLVHRKVEEGRIAMRNVRRDAADELKHLEKDKEMSQDELKMALNKLQKLTDSFVLGAGQMGKDKETELLEV